MTTIDQYQDVLDVREIIARVEELEGELEETDDSNDAARYDLQQEHNELSALLADLKGYSSDEQWRGDRYPVTLIRDSYFESYAQELAEDIGAIKDNAQWPYTCIDWELAARELQMDYTGVEFHGVTYWCR